MSLDYQIIANHLCNFGLMVNDIKIDGKLHRVPTIDKPKNLNGYYICHQDALIIGDWGTDRKEVIHIGRGVKYSKLDTIKFRKARLDIRKEKEVKQSKAANVALKLFKSSEDVPLNHPYMIKKQIKPTPLIKYHNKLNCLIAALIDIEIGSLMNVQKIFADGHKRFLAGGKVKGTCFPVGVNKLSSSNSLKKLLICEGIATALSLYEHSKTPTLAAINAGNLKAIAIQSRLLWPDADIILAADDDYLTELKSGKNIGLDKANEAATLINAKVSYPKFSNKQRKAGLTDWNDYFTLCTKQGRCSL